VRELGAGIRIEDAELVQRARGGDRWAEEVLYHRHVSYIMGMVARCLGDRNEAEDVVQDTFAIGFDRLGTLRELEAVRSWFAQIAIRLVRRRLQRAKLFAAIGIGSVPHVALEVQATQETDPETRAELASIGRVLSTLPTQDRIAWMLRNIEGEPLDEVARLCGCSRATVKRRIGRVAQCLEAHLGLDREEP
jgi:RNA polymerase sigma-70 factor (ECF subfamily)